MPTFIATAYFAGTLEKSHALTAALVTTSNLLVASSWNSDGVNSHLSPAAPSPTRFIHTIHTPPHKRWCKSLADTDGCENLKLSVVLLNKRGGRHLALTVVLISKPSDQEPLKTCPLHPMDVHHPFVAITTELSSLDSKAKHAERCPTSSLQLHVIRSWKYLARCKEIGCLTITHRVLIAQYSSADDMHVVNR